MVYNHEYHLAGTPGPDPAESPVIPKLQQRRHSLVTLLIIFGFIGAVALIVLLYITHQYILLSPVNDAKLGVSTNASLVKERFVGNNEVTQYERRFQESLSQSERDIIHKLRVEFEDQLTYSYMKTDSYLIRWLKARDWDLEDAKEMLQNHLEWRVEYEIDTIMESNFTFFEQEFPYHADGYDYQGRPVITINLGDMDMRKVALGGYGRDFQRYCFREFERKIAYVMDCQAKGMNVSQAVYILDVGKFSLKQHACLSCISVTAQYLFGVDDNYPGWLNPILIINLPDAADLVKDILLPYLSGENRAAVKVFGTNKAEWQREILSLMSADQIRPEFGGTKVDLEA